MNVFLGGWRIKERYEEVKVGGFSWGFRFQMVVQLELTALLLSSSVFAHVSWVVEEEQRMLE